jgi:hypothetical protein
MTLGHAVVVVVVVVVVVSLHSDLTYFKTLTFHRPA